jgi:hypothetical protein
VGATPGISMTKADRARHPSAPPDVPRLIQILATHQIECVVVGSTAAKLYGVALEPRDFDIVPALRRENLDRLCGLLVEVEASLSDDDEIGRWQVQPDGESKWITRKATPAERRERADWVPRADDVATLDHLMLTRHGNLDVVPSVAGGYPMLRKRAVAMKVDGHDVWVAHVDDLLAALTVPRQPRFVDRVRALREIQRARGAR